MAKRAAKSAAIDEPMLAPEKRDDSPQVTVKYPVTLLEQVIGQAAASRTLQSAMERGRVHHAWIFHGPAGVGKFTAAVAFAAAILDSSTQPDLMGKLAPDPASQVHQLIRAGTHPDLHIITKELAAVSREDTVRRSKQMGIAKEVIEEFLIEPALRSRVLGGTAPAMASKVFIVDEAELLGPATQNALLKTLEEPPAGTVIILVTNAEERLLPTIRSRAQRVWFGPLTDQDMTLWMSGRGGEADLGAVAPDKRAWLLRFSSGSPGAANIAIEHDLFSWHAALGKAIADTLSGQFVPGLGATMAELIDERAAAAVKANPDASKDAANKAWARRMMGYLAEDLRHQLRTRVGTRAQDDVESDPMCARLLHALDAIAQAETFLGSNVNLGQLLEHLAGQMSSEPAGI